MPAALKNWLPPWPSFELRKPWEQALDRLLTAASPQEGQPQSIHTVDSTAVIIKSPRAKEVALPGPFEGMTANNRKRFFQQVERIKSRGKIQRARKRVNEYEGGIH
jgi:hypothetical protein